MTELQSVDLYHLLPRRQATDLQHLLISLAEAISFASGDLARLASIQKLAEYPETSSRR